MQYYSSGWKKTVKLQQYFNGTSWSYVKQRWVMVGGVWKMLVPNNAVILYHSVAPATSIVCDSSGASSYGVPNMDGLYARGDGAALQTSPGDMAHNGASHGGGNAAASSPFTPTKGDASIGATSGAMDAATAHTHNVGHHIHGGSATPEVNNITLVPTMGDDKLRANAVFFANQDTSLAGMTAMTDAWIKRYLKFGGTAGLAGSAFDHGHANASFTTDPYYAPGVTQLQPSQTTWQYVHNHGSDAHAIGPASVEGPVAHHLAAFKLSSEMFFSDLPSGSICAFTDGKIPAGWTIQVYYYIRIWKSGTVGAEGDSHYHTGAYYNLTASFSNNLKSRGNDADKTGEYVINQHTHTISDAHTVAKTNYLPYIRLAWARKN